MSELAVEPVWTTGGPSTLRVLHVSQPVEAGVPNVVSALVTDQLERGYDVHVACPPGAGLAERSAAHGARVHSWPAVRTPSWSVPAEMARLRRIVDAVQPDVVVLHSAKAGLAGRLALRGRVPTVFVPHAWSFEAVRNLMAAASRGWEVVAGRWTDVVVCVSDDERKRGRDVGVACAIDVVPNGVDVVRRGGKAAGRAREALGLPDRPTVVCVGRLAEQKGQDLLLQAWPQVLDAVPHAQLVLVGDGPTRSALEPGAPSGVTFVGARSDVDEYFAAADVVALPSRWESTPLVALEAMAASRPVVAFEVDGLRAAFGDTGVILPQGDLSGFADALVGFLDDRLRAEKAGRAGRARVVAVGDVRTGVARWDEILTTVARGTEDRPKPLEALDVMPTTGLAQAFGSGALGRADLAVPDPSGRFARARGAVLSALGVTVWWRGDPQAAPPALGAPVLTGEPGDQELARAARRPGAGLDGPPVSVVVTVLNEGPALAALVENLLSQVVAGDEVIIVDGGSVDGSIESLPQHTALRTVVVQGAGISAGRNHGVRLARNEVIVCTDAGCVPEPQFLQGFRQAFAAPEPPALVSGVYTVAARNAMERAQSAACYPQPAEVRRPNLFVRAYTRVFGTGFDARFAVGRCVAFTREAWAAVDGFPEHLATGEDVSFGLAVSRTGACEATTDAVVAWQQRDGVAATWRMYRGYGRASTAGGDRALLLRDGVRGLAYLVLPALLARRRTRRIAVLATASYLSLPAARAVRARAGLAAIGLLPVAMATKDLGKVAGALQGLRRKR